MLRQTSLRQTLERRLEALLARARALGRLRELVGLRPANDLTADQWAALDTQLNATSRALLARLDAARSGAAHDDRNLNVMLGRMELELATAYTFFDTYMDVLTQRLTPDLAPLLAGCDRLAWDAMSRPHPALRLLAMPVVFCDRGFAAAIIRQDVRLPGRSVNPLPLIQVPYSRLLEKYNLTSVLHEAGHQSLARLGLLKSLRAALGRAVSAKAHNLPGRFALWTSEIAPDFWGFCLAGAAQASSVRDILSLPPADVFRLSEYDPHPPPFLRVLLSFEWCRQVWGSGLWDEWERDWLRLYPLRSAPPDAAKILALGYRELPRIAQALLTTPLPPLGGKSLPELFDLASVHPERIANIAGEVAQRRLRLATLPPCSQLSVFRAILDRSLLPLDALDRLMTQWLMKLGRQSRGRLEQRRAAFPHAIALHA